MKRIVLILAVAAGPAAAQPYTHGPDSVEQPGVPQGKITKRTWESKVFPGTVRNYWVYVPSQYDPKTPACVMVFQDGQNYADRKRDFRVPVVFDNLIHKKEMPVTVGVFVNPGHIGSELPADPWRSTNRSHEYDTLSEHYARFLLGRTLERAHRAGEALPHYRVAAAMSADPEYRERLDTVSARLAA